MIEPENMAAGKCPCCRKPSRNRHCGHCRWLVCVECGVVWSGRYDTYFSSARYLSDGPAMKELG